MNVIEQGTKSQYFPDDTVKGVELDGLTDAIALASKLNAYGLRQLDPSGLDPTRIPGITDELGVDALSIQAKLLKEIGSGTIVYGSPFTFRAITGQAGRILRAAVQLPDSVVEQLAARPQSSRLWGQQMLAAFALSTLPEVTIEKSKRRLEKDKTNIDSLSYPKEDFKYSLYT